MKPYVNPLKKHGHLLRMLLSPEDETMVWWERNLRVGVSSEVYRHVEELLIVAQEVLDGGQ